MLFFDIGCVEVVIGVGGWGVVGGGGGVVVLGGCGGGVVLGGGGGVGVGLEVFGRLFGGWLFFGFGT